MSNNKAGINYSYDVAEIITKVVGTEQFQTIQGTNHIFRRIEETMLRNGALSAKIPKNDLFFLYGANRTTKVIKLLALEGFKIDMQAGNYLFSIEEDTVLSQRVSYLRWEVMCTRSFRITGAKKKLLLILGEMMNKKEALQVKIPLYKLLSWIEGDILEDVLARLFEEGMKSEQINGSVIFKAKYPKTLFGL